MRTLYQISLIALVLGATACSGENDAGAGAGPNAGGAAAETGGASALGGASAAPQAPGSAGTGGAAGASGGNTGSLEPAASATTGGSGGAGTEPKANASGGQTSVKVAKLTINANAYPELPSVPETPSCVSLGYDEPDDLFEDTNCDGIDGDASKAVFVSPSGNDQTGNGSREKPYKSIQLGLMAGQLGDGEVYVCNGTYVENIDATHLPGRVYGGYDCTQDWARTDAHAVVEPTAGIPLVIRSTSAPVVFERIDFHAPPGVAPGGSSLAAWVEDAENVKLTRTVLRAGSGAAAGTVPDAEGSQEVPPAGFDGESAHPWFCAETSYPYLGDSCAPREARGTASFSFTCPVSGKTTWSGAGGHGQDPKIDGSTAEDGAFGYPTGVSPRGDALWGATGAAGEPARSGFGSVVPGMGYVATNEGAQGAFGDLGAAGKGGKGGRGYVFWDYQFQQGRFVGGGGGSGAFGGCPGVGGKGGKAGGGSIALLSVNSTVKLSRASLITSNGGRGGAGGRGGGGGGPGVPGRGGFSSSTVFRSEGTAYEQAVDGAIGGKGGDGGDGGGGGGGPSVTLVYVGTAPLLELTTFIPNAGGKGGTDSQGRHGAQGESAQSHHAG